MFKRGDFVNLSLVQEKIVNEKNNLIVRASAGTGKTHTMVAKISKELNENETHKVIAAITFTIKAAREIKERLSIDVNQQFIGTNNSFAIEEVIKPFMKDVYGEVYNTDMDTDYSNKINTFSEGLKEIQLKGILSSYEDNTKNFIFELAYKIATNSKACQLYLISKYFKIYIDEYQDCDRDMHKFFMYLCENLKIEMFVVGDEKQSIYMWRGAYPEAFKTIWEKNNFSKIFMGENFRSCQQIQNYTNILFEETRDLYSKTEVENCVIWINIESHLSWESEVLKHIDIQEPLAVLRFSNANSKIAAKELSEQGLECVFIPQIPIADITTETAWLYIEIAKYCILEYYSVYNLISEIPVESDESKKNINRVNNYLKDIKQHLYTFDKHNFNISVNELAEYLNYTTREEHLVKLYNTIENTEFHVAFEPDKYKHVSITFHSSKGLEFEQVILFAEDYRLNDLSSIYNHYVASSRAKKKLIIIRRRNSNSNHFERNLKSIINESNLDLEDLIDIIE